MSRLRLLTAGESHGPKLSAILEGLPAGLELNFSQIDDELARRQRGYGRGQRSRSIERDQVTITGGVRFGETLGGPVALEIANLDHASWIGVMDVAPIADHTKAVEKALTRPRPGHADLAGGLKYDRSDLRDVLERASARNTCVRVAAGAIARQLLRRLKIEVVSFVDRIGGVSWSLPELIAPDAISALAQLALASDVACPDAGASAKMRERIDRARKDGDTVGGSFVVCAIRVPVGLGSHVDVSRRLDGRLAQALMSVQAVKAVEIGLGVSAGDVAGSEAHDVITFDSARADACGYGRPTNRAGGIEGGMSNGAPIFLRATMKPIATLARPLESVDLATKAVVSAAYERSDVCAVPACAAIAEAEVALTLADAVLEAYGGDTVSDILKAHAERDRRMRAR